MTVWYKLCGNLFLVLKFSKLFFLFLSFISLQISSDATPTTLITDFEQASISAFKDAFPNIKTTGCFFHLSQSVWRKVQKVGLQQRYGQDADFATRVRVMPALAFLPLADVEQVFNELIDNDYFVGAEAVADYFETHYIGRPYGRAGRRRAPTFPLELWNQGLYSENLILIY